MNILTPQQFDSLIAQAHIKPRLKRELRFTASTSHMADDDWRDTELLPITDRSGTKGVLLLAPSDTIYVVAYQLSKLAASRQTGRPQPIICDFCRTWQSGGNAASISFFKDKQSASSTAFLCCADLACSQHVRTKTQSSRLSRAQLREDLTNEQRVLRLKDRLQVIIGSLNL